MWSVITRIFVRSKPQDLYTSLDHQASEPVGYPFVHEFNSMDHGTMEERRKGSTGFGDQYYSANDEHYNESSDGTQAKQRASIKWLLSKAYNNRVPENFREPYYRDHEDQEHLKPQIVHALSNAELYCLALATIYSDPNYHNQNHSGILQALARKGVNVTESNGPPLTETVLIQNSPIKMSSHMAVIEGLMILYAKEVVTADRVLAAIQRFDPQCKIDAPADHESGLLAWISHAIRALIAKIKADEGAPTENTRLPELPAAKDFQSLCDGVSIAAVVAFYCPSELDYREIRVSKRPSSGPSVSDALHNLSLVQEFCVRCLPFSIFHMQPEDVTYMRSSMKQNLIVFLAELYNVLEIHPAKCVRYPGENKAQQYLEVTKSTVHSMVKKSQSMQHTSEVLLNEDRRTTSEEAFVIHRSRGSSVGLDEKTMHREAAGRPTNWDENKRSTYAGRRSRRNSITEDSQLTIENFGGSQDNLHNIGRNPDKVGKNPGRRIFAEPTVPARSHIQDAYGSGLQSILADNGHSTEEPTSARLRRQKSNPNLSNVSLKNILHSTETDHTDGERTKMSSFATLSRSSEKVVNLNFRDQNKEDSNKVNLLNNQKHEQSNGTAFVEKKTSFATLPNMTTWQQQSNQHTQQLEKHTSEENSSSSVMASQLNNIRLKLEEKKRRIESEKRRMEMAMSKTRQKVGKAAFLQAVTKEITEDVRDVEQKWLDQDGVPFVETRRTPDIENMDLDQYHQSISHMNNSLTDIQADIQRLASQQNQIQQQQLLSQQQQMHQLHQLHSLSQQHLHTYGVSPQNQMIGRVQEHQQSPQFYLHDQPQVPRRTWGQPQPIQSLTNEIAAHGYQQSLDSRYSSPPIYQQDPRMYQDTRSWGMPIPQQKGFILHDNLQDQYLNGGENSLSNNQHHLSSYPQATLYSQTPPSAASPQHRNSVNRISQLMNDSSEIKRPNLPHHMPLPSESPVEKRLSSMPIEQTDCKNRSYSGDDEDFTQGIRNLNITSGSRTYRIPSPTRPVISRNSFQPHTSLREATPSPSGLKSEVVPLDQNETPEKGFYISFDDTPKKPKPSLRQKKASPKKERSASVYMDRSDYLSQFKNSPVETPKHLGTIQREPNRELQKHEKANEKEIQKVLAQERITERPKIDRTNRQTNSVGMVIGTELTNLDPNSVDEMERKKERIMLLSLQRRQQQEELKERKEAEALARREQEKLKEEERARKKEEEKQRRAVILEQYKLKKAIEEAEREGKVIDKELLNAIKPVKHRNKGTPGRPRPKTIHVDAGSELDSGVLTPCRGKKGSSSNLSTVSLTSPSMRRDFYRGSQDSLSVAHLEDRRSGSLYRGSSLRDSPDDGRSSSPTRSTNQLGRRGSYKTGSRDHLNQDSQQQIRGRPKYPSYQNFKGRKSSSMMNLCDTDSGLGRATPPRRAISPGMGSMRHLPSPSGPGSLPPGLMTKRRVFDDGSSDISSTASSMMDYNGPRLYKQPATKSNRGIMLNAVEYCVFPGIVNREAKRRVLDEISRSESKHFLILFRDAGCQFRALYSYCPERDEVSKLYGTGPKQVVDKMFDKFFKYNSGGKCFSQVHTKHLTVTIDAFTIHNSLWQGKKVNLPSKKDMTLVI